MQSHNKLIFGILGGMGPLASAYTYLRLVEKAQKEYGAVQDTDYPHLLINSIALDAFDETGIRDSETVHMQLKTELDRLADAGCNNIIMACNTVHVLYEKLRDHLADKSTLINLPNEVAKRIVKHSLTHVGILSSETTRSSQLYQHALEKHNIIAHAVTEAEQQELNKIIMHVMGGNHTTADTDTLGRIARNLIKRHGVEGIVVACTELPIPFPTSFEVPIFDTIATIADVILEKHYSTTNSTS